MRRLALLLVLSFCTVGTVAAQTRPDDRFERPSRSGVADGGAVADEAAVLASLVLPGAGQKLQGNLRWALYLGFETWSWIRYVDHRGDGASLEQRYRDLAWHVARGGAPEPRRDGDFDYYESMAQFESSGRFDVDPAAAGIQPETDPSTFNGAAWSLAGQIFFPAGVDPDPASPEYAAALAFYKEQAIPSAFAWSWTGAAGERSRFRALIRDSDAAFRDATVQLGLILANHLVSAVDALITGRSHRASPEGTEGHGSMPIRLYTELDRDGRHLLWNAGLSIRWSPR